MQSGIRHSRRNGGGSTLAGTAVAIVAGATVGMVVGAIVAIVAGTTAAIVAGATAAVVVGSRYICRNSGRRSRCNSDTGAAVAI